MSLNFVIPEWTLGGNGNSPFTFYRRGWNLGSSGSTPSYKDIILSGNTALTLVNAKADGLNYLKLFGGTEQVPETYIDSVTAEGKCVQTNVPEGYTEYDGLIGDGTAYIDLNCPMTQDDELEIEFSRPSGSVSRDIGGFRSGASSNNISALIASSGNLVADFNNSNYTDYRLNVAINADTRYKVIVNKTGRYLYDSTGTLIGSNTTPCSDTIACTNCYLFFISSTVGARFNGTIYRASIKGKRDVVPCSNGTEYGMYDKLNNVFYTNAGKGSFTAGNAVTPTPTTPVDIVCNNGAVKCSPNLANMIADNITVGYYISNTGVVTASDQNFIYNKYIPVKPNTTYTLSASSSLYFMSISEYSTAQDSGFIVRNAYSTNVTSGTLTTGATTNYIRFGANISNSTITLATVQSIDWMLTQSNTAQIYMPYGQIYVDGTTETITDNVGNVATCENLLSVGDYKDTQEILSGAITRNIGIKVLDGTESWTKGATLFYSDNAITDFVTDVDFTPYCTHYEGVSSTSSGVANSNTIRLYKTTNNNRRTGLYAVRSDYETADDFANYLAQQYAAGTPVIIVYPTSSATTETVSGQVLTKSPVTYSGSISGLTGTTVTSSHTTPTPTNPLQLKCNNGVVKVSPNLLSPTNIHQGSINATTGTISNLPNRCYYDYIPVKQGDVIWVSTKTSTPPVYANFMYYTDKNESTFYGRQVGTSFSFDGNIGYYDTSAINGYVRGVFLQQENFTPSDIIDAQIVIQENAPTTYRPYGTTYTDGTVETVEVKDENNTVLGTATATDLYAIGTYKDVQSVLDGGVTRNVGVTVLKGTETWGYDNYVSNMFSTSGKYAPDNLTNRSVYSTHFRTASSIPALNARNGYIVLDSSGRIAIGYDAANGNVTTFKQWLSDQYNAGNPVIAIYPKRTAATESVTPQSLTIQQGTNVVEITQASIDGLPLEVSYKAGVEVTVEEVEAAQLDEDVTVTVS